MKKESIVGYDEIAKRIAKENVKKTKVVAKKSFINRYGNKIVNGMLACAMLMFAITMFTTNLDAKDSSLKASILTHTTKADEVSNEIHIKEIIAYDNDSILTADGEKYAKANAKQIIEDEYSNGVVCSAIIVNGECTEIMFDISQTKP